MSRSYDGSELEMFADTDSWKAYLAREISPFLGRRVLEVGAGIGGTTRALALEDWDRWICLEPDRHLARHLHESVRTRTLPKNIEVVSGMADAFAGGTFDTVLYIDVLEHVEDDYAELGRAARLLVEGGHIVVLSPAHPWLYSRFDQALGHFRRYTRSMIRALTRPGLELLRCTYLDSVGLIASTANRFLLRQAAPTRRQVLVWDRWFVRSSILLDRLLGYRLGKSILAVWSKPGAGP